MISARRSRGRRIKNLGPFSVPQGIWVGDGRDYMRLSQKKKISNVSSDTQSGKVLKSLYNLVSLQCKKLVSEI